VLVDGDSNKENIPPFNLISLIHTDIFPRTPPPSPPTSLLSIHARVRALLRSTCNSTSSSIAGRDVERTSLLQFLTSFIDGTSMDNDILTTSMFISGAPGTGKTALVNAIIRDLSAKNGHVKVISINCMALKGVDALWERIIEDLAPAPKRKSTATKKTNAYDRLKALLSTLNTQWYVLNITLNYLTQAQIPPVFLF
jgi:cell division control protein 6